MEVEFNSIERNYTWELVPQPHHRQVNELKWIFKTKYHVDGTLDKGFKIMEVELDNLNAIKLYLRGCLPLRRARASFALIGSYVCMTLHWKVKLHVFRGCWVV